ncbi:hypothetical protein D9619_004861 [Psilocybe cf. subviscida]|uniref:Uncharacterized protein n=1 Tax=Psilocybe cf. subviscida TaxID=2480587 RepID=A0A8H5BQT1_9AGAR|nr:hypothetical protein D9619_004861 [Psilocybe cf. subviscida]
MTLIAIGLHSLPIELLHDIQLYALSETLPHVSQHFYYVYKRASAFYHANYILGRILQAGEPQIPEIYSKALRYPLCDEKVLTAVVGLIKVRLPNRPPSSSKVQLPRRLFRDLDSDSQKSIEFLHALYRTCDIPQIDTNANEGYALARAVHAKCVPLVKLLLEHHASPKRKDCLAVKVAIRQRSVEMVKLLVERPVDPTLPLAKKRKTGDRVELTSEMLRMAIGVGAHEVVEYLYREKSVIPDFQTLKRMGS